MRFLFSLAKELKKTVAELCETLTYEEMLGWAAFAQIENEEFEKQREKDIKAQGELQTAMEEGEKYSEGATETLAEAMSVGEDRDPTGTAGAFTGEPTGMEDEYD